MSAFVSILIPCYNAERWIARAIESALAQTWPNKEVIVVDDGSTDGSLAVIRSFDGRIRWESGPNQGGNAARNRLLQLARGDWVQYLDADDYLRSTKLERQLQVSREHLDSDVICGPTAWERLHDGQLVCTDEIIPEPRDPWVLLAKWQLPQTGGPLWRRAALNHVKGWRVGQPCCQEHELYLRLLASGRKFEFSDDCLAVYCDSEETTRVTRKVPGEVDRQRLIIFDRMEQALAERNELTTIRLQAINDARHQLARKYWRSDKPLKASILAGIRRSDPNYLPDVGPASPPNYIATYRLLGFEAAQLIASLKRQFLPSFRQEHN
ncbi:glycosyltransferase [Bradyrhizobium sp. 200]|uniref:glycosyltransferase n=1 Tax=Bradyrhizobium sp. 200 TaxID=2782665 RepID=UPI0020004C0E|nr:glycosyltransferase [Bradyrhizobium sp. 200]UPJ51723.1 glycosyltransferase [Bradyrhizobium sp. 200]